VLGGRVVRILHSVADGACGGESLVRGDPVAKEIVYDCFTTASFTTHGKMSVPAPGRLECHEIVRGDAGGVAEVKATMELLPDGRMKVSSRMLRSGAWEERPPKACEVDAAAKVVLP
jgi:hypothetical protein